MKLDLLEDLVYLGVCLKLVMKTLDSGETILAEPFGRPMKPPPNHHIH
jgi:hypothetical protein